MIWRSKIVHPDASVPPNLPTTRYATTRDIEHHQEHGGLAESRMNQRFAVRYATSRDIVKRCRGGLRLRQNPFSAFTGPQGTRAPPSGAFAFGDQYAEADTGLSPKQFRRSVP